MREDGGWYETHEIEKRMGRKTHLVNNKQRVIKFFVLWVRNSK
jgi:hypothetical protein